MESLLLDKSAAQDFRLLIKDSLVLIKWILLAPGYQWVLCGLKLWAASDGVSVWVLALVSFQERICSPTFL